VYICIQNAVISIQISEFLKIFKLCTNKNASYQVSVHLAEVSEEKIKMWKVNRRRMPSDGKSSHCLWQGELKRVVNNFTIPCLGPLNWYIFGSWIFSVSEYTIQIYPVYSEGYLRKILVERRGKFEKWQTTVSAVILNFTGLIWMVKKTHWMVPWFQSTMLLACHCFTDCQRRLGCDGDIPSRGSPSKSSKF
jgi:hypothetical protein